MKEGGGEMVETEEDDDGRDEVRGERCAVHNQTAPCSTRIPESLTLECRRRLQKSASLWVTPAN